MSQIERRVRFGLAALLVASALWASGCRRPDAAPAPFEYRLGDLVLSIPGGWTAEEVPVPERGRIRVTMLNILPGQRKGAFCSLSVLDGPIPDQAPDPLDMARETFSAGDELPVSLSTGVGEMRGIAMAEARIDGRSELAEIVGGSPEVEVYALRLPGRELSAIVAVYPRADAAAALRASCLDALASLRRDQSNGS